MMVRAKNNQTLCTRHVIEHSTLWNTAEYCWCVRHYCHGYHFCFVSVKYEYEEMVKHKQTKELSGHHNTCCLNEVVLGCYVCFGCISVMYQQHITVKIG